MRLPITLMVLALSFIVGAPVSSYAQSKNSSAAETDAKRRAKLRMQRNERILSQKEIEAAMATHVPAILDCYQTNAAKQKRATGELQLEMLIRPEGSVHRLWVRARGVQGQKLNECVQKLATSWLFPKKPGFTNAIVPFYFQKTKAKGAGPLESCWNAKGCPDKKRRNTK